VRLLLDTHAFLWFLLDNPKLSVAARDLIDDPSNDIELSPATYWEIAIKLSLRKYELPEPFEVFIAGTDGPSSRYGAGVEGLFARTHHLSAMMHRTALRVVSWMSDLSTAIMLIGVWRSRQGP
jgi:hypothetical protein